VRENSHQQVKISHGDQLQMCLSITQSASMREDEKRIFSFWSVVSDDVYRERKKEKNKEIISTTFAIDGEEGTSCICFTSSELCVK
jgi:hypothetical protein